jgi:serine/threonine-protein kinase
MLDVGDEMAGYRIERLIGRGGMGVVYEATQLSLDRRVALKVLTPDLTTDELFRARFRREGRIQARLDHPHIISVHEAGEASAGLFLAMRFVGGPTLKALIVARELGATRAMRILTPVAGALDAAHAFGLVHRDVKPQNILVAPGDHPYLADFGLTKSTSETAITADGNFIGTLDYIAPEQVRAHRRLLVRRHAVRGSHRRCPVPAPLAGGRHLRAYGDASTSGD